MVNMIWLVVEPTHLKNRESSPNRGEHTKYLKPPPSYDQKRARTNNTFG